MISVNTGIAITVIAILNIFFTAAVTSTVVTVVITTTVIAIIVIAKLRGLALGARLGKLSGVRCIEVPQPNISRQKHNREFMSLVPLRE